jgi:NADH-quinone oxidoreductase subunit F
LDLKLMDALPTGEERAAVDELLGPPETGWEGGARDAASETRVARGGRAVRDRRQLLLPALHALQARVGWVSRGGLNYVCQRLTVPPAEAYGVATFYALLSVEPRPATVVHVCDDLACRLDGDVIGRDLEAAVGPPGEPTAGGASTWVRSPCLGMCERPPAVLVQRAGAEATDDAVGGVATTEVRQLLDGAHVTSFGRPTDPRAASAPQTWDEPGRAGLRLLRRVGAVDPDSIDDYRAHDGFGALRRALELGPEGVILEVTDA